MIYIMSRNKCIEIAKRKYPSLTDEEELTDWLPESIFSKTFTPLQSDDNYHVVQHSGNLWFVPFEFTTNK